MLFVCAHGGYHVRPGRTKKLDVRTKKSDGRTRRAHTPICAQKLHVRNAPRLLSAVTKRRQGGRGVQFLREMPCWGPSSHTASHDIRDYFAVPTGKPILILGVQLSRRPNPDGMGTDSEEERVGLARGTAEEETCQGIAQAHAPRDGDPGVSATLGINLPNMPSLRQSGGPASSGPTGVGDQGVGTRWQFTREPKAVGKAESRGCSCWGELDL
jgi:hypothetical protein